ncbi:MAG: family 1 glycosylhydrolase [Propionibacteriaceae bacterium]|nr:family 1 glycosylhydrolase [Propionibacteriaceae bacterium]
MNGIELGVATAATQIEGGRVDSNWQHWADVPGNVADGSTPERAADHWNRVDQDLELLLDLNVKHYRMGLEWARIEPEPGVFSGPALDHYADELTELCASGIKPLVTLHHFNNPWWFEELGGFENPNAVTILTRYTRQVVERLGGLVDEWITINEPNVYATQGWYFGVWPPGKKSLKDTLKVMQTCIEAHVAMYNTIHSIQPDAKVGVAHHLRLFRPARKTNPLDWAGARAMAYLFQGALVKAMTLGEIRPPFKRNGIEPGQYADFHGVNYYTPNIVRGFTEEVAPNVAVNDLGWEIYPAGIAQICRRLDEIFPAPIYITENGTADAADAWRSRFLYDHLKALAESGLPVKRYYHWCFTDNWEWVEGEEPRFGLVELDYDTQERRVRDSGRFFADMSWKGEVTEEAYSRWVANSHYRKN